MSGKKNEAFENAWSLYSDKIKRKRMEKFLPGVARLFSSGNKIQAEQEFNAEMRALIHPNESGGSLSLIANELAWAASGKIPASKMDDIYGNDGGGNKGHKAATSTMLSRLRNSAIQYFSENPDELENAERYPGKVKQFKDEGFDDKTSALYALPTDKFKQLAQDMDTKAGMIYSGKDNKKRSVASSFYDAGYKPEDLKDPASAKKALSKITGGNLTETLSEEKNLDNLEQYARDIGFVNSDALLDYLATSYDRSNRLREQEDDNILTKAAKGVAIPNINKKWDEGVPANTKDVVHDAALFALEIAPQGKAVGMLGKVIKNAAPKSRAILKAENVMASPWVQYIGRKSYLPAEAAFLDNALNGKQEGIDWADIAGQTAGNATLDIGLTGALRGLYRLPLFRGAPKNFINGTFLSGDKKIAQDLEKRAYEMALETEAGQAAHNIMLRSNPDSRANPSRMYKTLSKNKNFRKAFNNLGEEAFDRVFNDAWNSAKQAGATTVERANRSLREALKTFDTYKKTKDFENALQSAAWEQAGYKGPNLLNQVRKGLYNFNLGLENADAATQAKLKNIYEDYAKERVGLNKVLGFLKYEGMPGLIRFGENVASVKRIYGPLYGQMLRGFGIKQDNNEK